MAEPEKVNIKSLTKLPVVGGNIYDRGSVTSYLGLHSKDLLDPMTTHIRMEMADAETTTRSHHRTYNEIAGKNGSANILYRDVENVDIAEENGITIGRMHKVEILIPRATIQVAVDPKEEELYQASKHLIISAVCSGFEKFVKDNYAFANQIKETTLYNFSIDLEFDQTLKNRERINDLRRGCAEINNDILQDKKLKDIFNKRSALFVEKAKLLHTLAQEENKLKINSGLTESQIELSKIKIADLEKLKSLLVKDNTKKQHDQTIKDIDTRIAQETDSLEKNELTKLKEMYLNPAHSTTQVNIQKSRVRLGEISAEISELRTEYYSLTADRRAERAKLRREITELKANDKLKNTTLLCSLNDNPGIQNLIFEGIEQTALYLLNHNNQVEERSTQKVFDSNVKATS